MIKDSEDKIIKDEIKIQFIMILGMELQKSLNVMEKEKRHRIENTINQLNKIDADNEKNKTYFNENFYKAKIGRKVSIIGRKFTAEGKIKSIDKKSKKFEMIINKSTDEKIIGLTLDIGEDTINEKYNAFVFE